MADADPRLITGERVVRSTTKHWIAPLGDSKWAILMVVGALVAAWLQGDTTTGVTGFVNRILELLRLTLFLGGLAWIVYNVVAWRTAKYEVTNRRVLGTDGLLRRRSTDTLLTSIADVRTVVPWFGRILGYGHIRIMSASGEAGADRFTSVRDVEDFKREVLEQKTGAAAMTQRPGSSGIRAAGFPPHRLQFRAPPPRSPPRSVSWPGSETPGRITAAEYEAKKTELLARI